MMDVRYEEVNEAIDAVMRVDALLHALDRRLGHMAVPAGLLSTPEHVQLTLAWLVLYVAHYGRDEGLRALADVGSHPQAPVSASVPSVQSGPRMPSPHGHRWGKPYVDGYATCGCGAVENDRDLKVCPLRGAGR